MLIVLKIGSSSIGREVQPENKIKDQMHERKYNPTNRIKRPRFFLLLLFMHIRIGHLSELDAASVTAAAMQAHGNALYRHRCSFLRFAMGQARFAPGMLTADATT